MDSNRCSMIRDAPAWNCLVLSRVVLLGMSELPIRRHVVKKSRHVCEEQVCFSRSGTTGTPEERPGISTSNRCGARIGIAGGLDSCHMETLMSKPSSPTGCFHYSLKTFYEVETGEYVEKRYRGIRRIKGPPSLEG